MSKDWQSWIIQAFDDAFALETFDYSKYIADDFTITINNDEFNFLQWQQHFNHIKALMAKLWVEYHEILVDGNRIFVKQLVHGIKKDGSKVVTKVMALVTVANAKIITIDELAVMAVGSAADQDLATIR